MTQAPRHPSGRRVEVRVRDLPRLAQRLQTPDGLPRQHLRRDPRNRRRQLQIDRHRPAPVRRPVHRSVSDESLTGISCRIAARSCGSSQRTRISSGSRRIGSERRPYAPPGRTFAMTCRALYATSRGDGTWRLIAAQYPLGSAPDRRSSPSSCTSLARRRGSTRRMTCRRALARVNSRQRKPGLKQRTGAIAVCQCWCRGTASAQRLEEIPCGARGATTT
jgi:hypothetical protein